MDTPRINHIPERPKFKAKRQTIVPKVVAVTPGRTPQENHFIFAPDIFLSLKRFIRQVKRLLIYIMPINPIKPNFGRKTRIKASLPSESSIEFLKTVNCWSSPLSSPSQTESKYIRGTRGDKSRIIRPE